jgi:hypothetical protein
MARPSEYNFEIAKEICLKLYDTGFKNVGQVIDADITEKYPSRATFYNWKRDYKELLDLYVNIQQDRGDLILEEIDQTILDLKNGLLDASTANVIIQTLKWKAAKFYPKMFGDKVQTEHSGEITTNVISLGSGIKPNEIIN